MKPAIDRLFYQCDVSPIIRMNLSNRLCTLFAYIIIIHSTVCTFPNTHMSRHRAASLAKASPRANGSESSEWVRGVYAVAGAATTWAIDRNGSKDENFKQNLSGVH